MHLALYFLSRHDAQEYKIDAQHQVEQQVKQSSRCVLLLGLRDETSKKVEKIDSEEDKDIVQYL